MNKESEDTFKSYRVYVCVCVYVYECSQTLVDSCLVDCIVAIVSCAHNG